MSSRRVIIMNIDINKENEMAFENALIEETHKLKVKSLKIAAVPERALLKEIHRYTSLPEENCKFSELFMKMKAFFFIDMEQALAKVLSPSYDTQIAEIRKTFINKYKENIRDNFIKMIDSVNRTKEVEEIPADFKVKYFPLVENAIKLACLQQYERAFIELDQSIKSPGSSARYRSLELTKLNKEFKLFLANKSQYLSVCFVYCFELLKNKSVISLFKNKLGYDLNALPEEFVRKILFDKERLDAPIYQFYIDIISTNLNQTNSI